MRSIFICAAFLGAAIGGVAVAQPDPGGDGSYVYIARVDGRVRQEGTVITPSGLRWVCAESACAIRGNWPEPGVLACRELAQIIGRVESYGRIGAMLSDADLATCNEGAPLPGDGERSSSAPTPGLPSAPSTFERPSSCTIDTWRDVRKTNPRDTALGRVYDRVCYNCRTVVCNAGDTAISGYASCGYGHVLTAVGVGSFGAAEGCSANVFGNREGYTAACGGPGVEANSPAGALRVQCLEAR